MSSRSHVIPSCAYKATAFTTAWSLSIVSIFAITKPRVRPSTGTDTHFGQVPDQLVYLNLPGGSSRAFLSAIYLEP
jgi:hypothetical protein